MIDNLHLRTPTIAEADWLRAPPTQQVFAVLNQGDHVARAVGGCVRNSLLALLANQVPALTDIDFATTATPQEVLALAAGAGLRTVPTGLQHGTVTIIADGEGFEVTTLRRDVATDGRHATVAFTDDWALDAARRDLTMNALYANADGTIFDPLGGYEDVVSQTVRFVGDPVRRIQEDYLRILRFFRFFAQYGNGVPDAAGIRACISERAGLAQLSAERIHQELMKLLGAPRAVKTLRIMADYGLLGDVLPAVPSLDRFERLSLVDLLPDRALRLAALSVFVKEDAARIGKSLRLSKRELAVLELAAETQIPGAMPRRSRLEACQLLYRMGEVDYVRWIQFCRASKPDVLGMEEWQQLVELPKNWQRPEFPVNGGDLIGLGAVPGPIVGEILRDLENWWVTSNFAADRDTLLGHARVKLSGIAKPGKAD